MALDTTTKKTLIEKYAQGPNDTGSPEVQVALLSTRIRELTEHFKTHHKDHASRRGLLKLVARRRALLNYVKGKDPNRYQRLIQELGLRK